MVNKKSTKPAKASGLTISVTQEERENINELQGIMGLTRKGMLISLVRERLAMLKNGQKPKGKKK